MKRKPNFKFNWKYALGEIVLIFIGISLAMGFDNWSQNKREREQLEGYLETIRKNVVSDTASIAETDSRYKSFHELALNHLNMAIHDEYS